MTTLTEATSTIRVYLVEDQALLRESLQAMLEPEPQVEFAGTASGGEEALEELQDLEVDVVLMNIRLPGALHQKYLVLLNHPSTSSGRTDFHTYVRGEPVEP